MSAVPDFGGRGRWTFSVVEPCPYDNWVEIDFDSSIPDGMPLIVAIAGESATSVQPDEAGEPYQIMDAITGEVVAFGSLDGRGAAMVALPPDVTTVTFFLGDEQRLQELEPAENEESRHWALDVPLQVVGGIRDAAQELIDLSNSGGIWLEKNVLAVGYCTYEIGADADNGWLELGDVLPGDEGYDPDSMAIPALPEVSEAESKLGGATRGTAQFLIGFIPAMRAVRFIRPVSAIGQTVKFAAVGAVVDATVFDPHQARLSNLLEQYPELNNPVTEYLAADPDDTDAEGRFKNALEGIVAGAVIGEFLRALRFIKLSRFGFKFELQFHTPRSYDVKQNLTHQIYKELGVLPDGHPRIDVLEAQQEELFGSIPLPANATGIE